MEGKAKFKEIVKVECFNKNGKLMWAEEDGKDIPIEEYKIKEKQNDK